MPIKLRIQKRGFTPDYDADGVSFAKEHCGDPPKTTVRDILRGRVNPKNASRQALVGYIKTLCDHIRVLEAAK